MSEYEMELLEENEYLEKKKAALEMLSRYKSHKILRIRKDIEAIDVALPLEDWQKILLNRISRLAGSTQKIRDS